MIFRLPPLKAAVFWDAENHADLEPSLLMTRLQRAFGVAIAERHAYADWRRPELSRLQSGLRRAGFVLHDAGYGRCSRLPKNAADRCMARGIEAVVARDPTIGLVGIVSGDGGFFDAVRWLQGQSVTVVVAADPLRASKSLLHTADFYMPVGGLAQRILEIDRLEHYYPYLTFGFVLHKTGIERADLEEMIRGGILLYGPTWRAGRGVRSEVWLNREAYEVRRVLNVMAEASMAMRIIGGPVMAQPRLLRNPKEREVQLWSGVLPMFRSDAQSFQSRSM